MRLQDYIFSTLHVVFISVTVTIVAFQSCGKTTMVNEVPPLTGQAQISADECVKRMYQHIHEENIDELMIEQIDLMCAVDTWRDFMTNK